MPRRAFVKEQVAAWQANKQTPATTFVNEFRAHYTNKSSFASCISRFKGLLRSLGCEEAYLSKLKPTKEETQQVKKKQKQSLELKCRSAITLRGCGDSLIMVNLLSFCLLTLVPSFSALH